MPRFAQDDVLNFKVAEAIIAKAREEEQEAQGEAERQRTIKEWKNDEKWKRGEA